MAPESRSSQPSSQRQGLLNMAKMGVLDRQGIVSGCGMLPGGMRPLEVCFENEEVTMFTEDHRQTAKLH